MSKLTHFDDAGAARMVDVGAKPETERQAVASGTIEMEPATLARIRAGSIEKGDVLGIARTAAIQGLKRCSELIPLCHPVRVTGVDLSSTRATTAAARASRSAPRCVPTTAPAWRWRRSPRSPWPALTIYDMCKAIDRGMRLTDVRLEAKSGGKSGPWTRQT